MYQLEKESIVASRRINRILNSIFGQDLTGHCTMVYGQGPTCRFKFTISQAITQNTYCETYFTLWPFEANNVRTLFVKTIMKAKELTQD